MKLFSLSISFSMSLWNYHHSYGSSRSFKHQRRICVCRWVLVRPARSSARVLQPRQPTTTATLDILAVATCWTSVDGAIIEEMIAELLTCKFWSSSLSSSEEDATTSSLATLNGYQHLHIVGRNLINTRDKDSHGRVTLPQGHTHDGIIM